MDCRTARLLLDFARPLCPELEPADAEALQTHLADCPECGPVAAAERRLDDHLGRAVRDVPVPADLKQRLLNRLSRERDAWWRRWILRGGAAAAALLLALAGAWYLWPLPRPTMPEIQANLEMMRGADEQKVVDFFRKEGFGDVTMPSDFNFVYLAEYRVEEFEGRRVPALVFERTEGADAATRVYARVLVLNDHRFNLADLRAGDKADSGSFKIRIIRSPVDPHTVFVVIHNATNLESTFARPHVRFG